MQRSLHCRIHLSDGIDERDCDSVPGRTVQQCGGWLVQPLCCRILLSVRGVILTDCRKMFVRLRMSCWLQQRHSNRVRRGVFLSIGHRQRNREQMLRQSVNDGDMGTIREQHCPWWECRRDAGNGIVRSVGHGRHACNTNWH